MDRCSRQELRKNKAELNSSVNQRGMIDIYRRPPPTTADEMSFTSSHGTFVIHPPTFWAGKHFLINLKEWNLFQVCALTTMGLNCK
jgi:hypothetical protein